MKIDRLVLGLAAVALTLVGCGPADESAPAATGDAAPATIEAQLASYPLTECVVSGEELGSMGDPVDFVHDGRLVRLCCKMCVGQVEKDPAKFLAMLDDSHD